MDSNFVKPESFVSVDLKSNYDEKKYFDLPHVSYSLLC